MFAILLLVCMAELPPQSPCHLPLQAPIAPCGINGCDCGCLEGGTCTCRPDGMKARGITIHTYKVYQMATADLYRPWVWIVSNKDYPLLTDSRQFGSYEEAHREVNRLNRLRSYAEWKAGLKARPVVRSEPEIYEPGTWVPVRRGLPSPGLAPRPATFAPVFLPSFAPSFGRGFTSGGAACAGGG